MKDKKVQAFTLMELLAVLVILAIIALIVFPIIGDVITNSKMKAFESSVDGLEHAVNLDYQKDYYKGEREYTYEDGNLFVCPECGYEWTLESEASAEETKVFKDANGNILNDGDTVTIIKDLKVKGSSSVLKQGTKVKGIRLVDGDHDIDCKIDRFGLMKLKSEFVKK